METYEEYLQRFEPNRIYGNTYLSLIGIELCGLNIIGGRVVNISEHPIAEHGLLWFLFNYGEANDF